MSLIKCPECGREVSEQAATCPQCGYPIREYVAQLKAGKPQPSKLENQASSPASDAPSTPANTAGIASFHPSSSASPSGKKRGGCTIFILSLVIVALLALAGWYLFFRGGSDADERTAYDRISRYEREQQVDSLEEALNDYFDTYNSDAYHYSRLKELNDRFFTERADWYAAKDLMVVDAIRHFLDVHPDGFFHTLAHQKLDSLSFAAALEANTREAYEQYISQFVGGAYVEEAQKKMTDLEKKDITIEEKMAAKETIANHFNALANNDKDEISSTLARKINSYIGKADATEEDIYAYMEHVNASNRTLVFTVKDAVVSKVDAAGRSVYNVQFNLEEATYSASSPVPASETEGEEVEEQPKPTSVKTFTGTAVLNESMKITSLVLRQ